VIIASCKNAADEMSYKVTEDANELAVEEDFDKVAFYEGYIEEKFEELVEEHQLNRNNANFPNTTKPSPQKLYTSGLEYRSIKLTPILHNSSYPYSYRGIQTYWDSSLQKEVQFEEIISIEENYQVIDGDSIPTVKIIWNLHSS
jgi:hypothetical protein